MQACKRLEAARLRAGLSEAQIAKHVGLPEAWYCDLEGFPDELFLNVSLAHLQLIADAVRVSPRELLTDTEDAGAHVSFEELTRKLTAYRASSGLSVAALSQQVGWELKDVLIDPSEFWNFNVDGLRDVCATIGIDWMTALPELPPELGRT